MGPHAIGTFGVPHLLSYFSDPIKSPREVSPHLFNVYM
ncbi:hypothetical protein ISN45_At02g026340 [Arabidopsis thaliana x Arabidopsis arenosa]|uniref:Uncharacterized protein n=4 Tax=Arabidopsis TaxID=3701 RepID=A0A5S9X3M2_ARATH|nr:uncharacterized protein AT2G31981 [Arabidopsis thaliana]AEC08616.1 hypothetical protein AT2G31981 [Arabidopsis thaliana]KAG7638165.1 hypothetical protein ISN45_At02g026340 [Arabidopsis thaliana x Arabidopsis arenosa]KAG7642784.1 hypothetical protein ISN44_As02g026630 [Arabidopsis suecica]CAA0374011.1 unnamed protein product [Arabidopsis thaliana]|eukprot:NP_001118429.1 hypothetical protein AT2G31981 [Arabidopsis thaliana]